MSGADEDWVRAAMTDDTMVTELLLRIRHTPQPRPPPQKPSALPPAWTVRQRRSRPVSVNNNSNPKKPAHRGSPTTPLSWSGATSLSCGSGVAVCVGSEESSRPISVKLSTTARSKFNGDSVKFACKRPRKKKTLTELKDEENSLLKERRDLKREMASLRMNLEVQRATNEKLKRMKMELQPRVDAETAVAGESISGRADSKLTACHPIPSTMPPRAVLSDKQQSSTPSGCAEENANAASSSDPKFVVPDLNIPFEEPSSGVIYGVS